MALRRLLNEETERNLIVTLFRALNIKLRGTNKQANTGFVSGVESGEKQGVSKVFVPPCKQLKSPV